MEYIEMDSDKNQEHISLLLSGCLQIITDKLKAVGTDYIITTVPSEYYEDPYPTWALSLLTMVTYESFGPTSFSTLEIIVGEDVLALYDGDHYTP
jgi:hypothetical protein